MRTRPRFPLAGTFVVTGETAGGCVVKETFEVFQTPYYLPTVEGTLQSVCPGDSAERGGDSFDDENFVSYEWVSDWNGGGGQKCCVDNGARRLAYGRDLPSHCGGWRTVRRAKNVLAESNASQHS